MKTKIDYPRVKEHFLENVKIVDIIERHGLRFVKDSGNRLKILCPFHSEDTPSLVVYLDSNSYFCFGCSVGGNCIDFVMAIQKKTFKQVLDEYAEGHDFSSANYYIDKSIKGSKKEELDLKTYIKNTKYHVNIYLRDYLAKHPDKKDKIHDCYNKLDDFFEKEGITEKEVGGIMDMVVEETK